MKTNPVAPQLLFLLMCNAEADELNAPIKEEERADRTFINKLGKTKYWAPKLMNKSLKASVDPILLPLWKEVLLKANRRVSCDLILPEDFIVGNMGIDGKTGKYNSKSL